MLHSQEKSLNQLADLVIVNGGRLNITVSESGFSSTKSQKL